MNKAINGYGGVVLLLASALTIFALSERSRSLRVDLSRAREMAVSLQPGLHAPNTPAFDVAAGDTVWIGQSPFVAQVYFGFNTGCPFCLQSIDRWKTISRVFLDNPNVRVLGISTESSVTTRLYVTRYKIPFVVVSLTDPRGIDGYRFGAVPQTLVLDSAGRVHYSRTGAINTQSAADSVIRAVLSLLE